MTIQPVESKVMVEIAIAFDLLTVGEKALVPFSFWLKYRPYLKLLGVPDGPSDHLPTED